MRSSAISDAFTVLGLQEGSSLDLVKTTYKQIALRIHPDKNPDNPAATSEFQRVSEAYRVLVKHLDQSSRPSSGFQQTSQFRGFSAHSFYGYDYSDDEDHDHESGYYEDDPDSDDDIAFYLWLFQEMMNRRERPQFKRPDHRTRRRRKMNLPNNSKNVCVAHGKNRLLRMNVESAKTQLVKLELLEKKSKVNFHLYSVTQQLTHLCTERLEAEKRQKDKIEAKRAQASAARKSAEDKARQILRQAQETRSIVFSAARKGEAEKVRKGIWENSVDAAGGEIKPNCAVFVRNKPQDLHETLLHIATKNGDLDLVKWLDSHSADPEERNMNNLTAFQVALKMGRIDIVRYFFENYPPEISDSKAIYDCSKCPNLISLALESHDPELVWLILERKLITSQEIHQALVWASSEEGQQILIGENATPSTIEKAEDIVALLERYGDIPAPTEPITTTVHNNTKMPAKSHSPTPSGRSQLSTAVPSNKVHSRQGRGIGRGRGRGRGRGSFHSPSH